MSSFPIERVHGDHTRKAPTRAVLNWSNILPPADLAASIDVKISALTINQGYDGPQYKISDSDGKVHFYDARTGQAMVEVSATEAPLIAIKNYSGPGEPVQTERIEETGTEYRGPVPAWRVEFDDWESTTLYIAAHGGRVMASRNTMWRIFDFVWMLHIMDYEERDDFNNPLLIIAALLAVILTISGVYMIKRTMSARDFAFLKRKAN